MKEATISRQRQRLRWTAELHERFVKAVGQLGGSDSKTHAYTYIHKNFCFHTKSMHASHLLRDAYGHGHGADDDDDGNDVIIMMMMIAF